MKRGPIIRAAALAFVVILVVALFVGCAKYDGDQAEFCQLLPKAPSFQSLALATTTGTTQDAAQKMRDAARDFRSLEQSAPRSIRAKVAALGDSAERIARRFTNPSLQDSYAAGYGYDNNGNYLPEKRSKSAVRMGVFYSEFSAHPGTTNAAIELLVYAQKDCGIENLGSTLGLNGYGVYDGPSPYGSDDSGGNLPAPTPSVGSQGGVKVIPPATSPLPPPASSIPETSTTKRAGATTNHS